MGGRRLKGAQPLVIRDERETGASQACTDVLEDGTPWHRARVNDVDERREIALCVKQLRHSNRNTVCGNPSYVLWQGRLDIWKERNS